MDTNPNLEQGVPQRSVLRWMDTELKEAKACRSIPFSMALLLVFVFVVNAHLGNAEMRAAKHALAESVEHSMKFATPINATAGRKSVSDIISVADIYSWLGEGLFPAVHSMPLSRPLIGGDILRYSTIIGSLRFQQSIAPRSTCALPDRFRNERPCYASTSFFSFPENTHWGPLETAMRVEHFLFSRPLSHWREKARDFELGCVGREACLCATCGDVPWLGPSAREMEISYILLNQELGLWSQVNVNFFFNRAGRIWPAVNIDSQWVDPLARSWEAGLMVLWFAMNLGLLARILKNIRIETTRRSGRWYQDRLWPSARTYFSNLWHVNDFITLSLASAAFATWLQLVRISHTLNAAFYLYADIHTSPQADRFFAGFVDLFRLEFLLRLLFSLYAFVGMIRLFKGFAAQPRLSLVTRTLSRASIDLVHFLFVFVSIFCAFGASGLALFGRRLHEFSSFALSINTLYRVSMGDLVLLWDEMKSVGFLPAAIFYWFFTIIVVYLMLNMLVSAVLAAYHDVKAEVQTSETLWSQAAESLTRWWGRRQKRLVGLAVVSKCLLDAVPDTGKSRWSECDKRRQVIGDEETMLTLTSLQALVPGLGRAEATEILQQSLLEHARTAVVKLEDKHVLDDVLSTLSQQQAAFTTTFSQSIGQVNSVLSEIHFELGALARPVEVEKDVIRPPDAFVSPPLSRLSDICKNRSRKEAEHAYEVLLASVGKKKVLHLPGHVRARTSWFPITMEEGAEVLR